MILHTRTKSTKTAVTTTVQRKREGLEPGTLQAVGSSNFSSKEPQKINFRPRVHSFCLGNP